MMERSKIWPSEDSPANPLVNPPANPPANSPATTLPSPATQFLFLLLRRREEKETCCPVNSLGV